MPPNYRYLSEEKRIFSKENSIESSNLKGSSNRAIMIEKSTDKYF